MTPGYVGATILVAGSNFGTGSSREHAVWALMDYGFEAVISPRFADIFYNNCTKQGLLPVPLAPEVVARLYRGRRRAIRGLEITIDVTRRLVEVPAAGIVASFEIDDFTAERFINGWDDIGLTLRHGDDLDAYEATRAAYLPTASVS